MNPKILCIGLPKTGTKSLCAALEILGYKTQHSVSRSRRLVQMVEAGRKTLPPWWDEFDAFADGPLFKIAEDMLRDREEVLAIIVRREVESWMNSRIIHVLHNRTRETPEGMQKIDTDAMRKLHRQANETYDRIKNHPRVLEFNPAWGWAPLCNFFAAAVPKVSFPRENQSVEKLRAITDTYAGRGGAQ